MAALLSNRLMDTSFLKRNFDLNFKKALPKRKEKSTMNEEAEHILIILLNDMMASLDLSIEKKEDLWRQLQKLLNTINNKSN